MPYSELMVAPMRLDLVRLGFVEMRTAVAMALETEAKPDLMTTVFAGQDMEATERAREYLVGYPPSSPSVALLQDGKLVYMMERHQIEGRGPEAIAADLKAALDQHCS